MTPARMLRTLILIEVASTLAASFANELLGRALPIPLRTYVENQRSLGLSYSALIIVVLFGCFLIASVGLWRLRPWGKPWYVGVFIATLVWVPFAEPQVNTPIAELFNVISIAASGMILMLLWTTELSRAEPPNNTPQTDGPESVRSMRSSSGPAVERER